MRLLLVGFLLLFAQAAAAQSTVCQQVGNYLYCNTQPAGGGIDPSIPLRVQPPQIMTPNEIMQLRLQRQQEQINQMQLEQMQQQQQMKRQQQQQDDENCPWCPVK